MANLFADGPPDELPGIRKKAVCGVNRRGCWLSHKRCGLFCERRTKSYLGGSVLVQKSLLELSKGKVRSQRRPVTGDVEGARQGQGGRGRVSASRGCQALTHAEALDKEVSGGVHTVISFGHAG